jgi:hypothetical protein
MVMGDWGFLILAGWEALIGLALFLGLGDQLMRLVSAPNHSCGLMIG